MRQHLEQPRNRYIASPGCKGKCETSDLIIRLRRRKGDTGQALGIGRCNRCSVYWKPEVGPRCPCCRQQISRRLKSKQSRQFREKQREATRETRWLSIVLNKLCSRTVRREEKPVYRIFAKVSKEQESKEHFQEVQL